MSYDQVAFTDARSRERRPPETPSLTQLEEEWADELSPLSSIKPDFSGLNVFTTLEGEHS